MGLRKCKLFWLFIFLISGSEIDAQAVKPDPDYGLAFASHEVSKDHRTSLNLNPESPFHFSKDVEIRFDLSFQRLTNAYGYILRIIANDSLNIDLVSSPSHNEFHDLNLIVSRTRTNLHFDFTDVHLKTLQWSEIRIRFSRESNQISLSWKGHKKIQSFPISSLQTFRFYFGANDFGKFNTSDVPPIILKNIEIRESDRITEKWALKKHQVGKVYDSVHNLTATVKNPIWLLDKHLKWVHRKAFTVGKYPSVAFNGQAGILFASDASDLYMLNLASGKMEQIENPEGNAIHTDANQLIYAAEINTLINYDLQTNKFSPFDFHENSWRNADTTYTEPDYWHHNKFYNPIDSSLYVFGGYGHFSYKNTFSKFDDSANQWVEVKTGGTITPRYLGASGRTPGKDEVLIFGGYGSTSGKQELFPQSFDDLYSFDLKSHKIRKLWDFRSAHTPDIVFSNSLVINEKDSCFYVLGFPKNKYESFIKLRQYGLYKPEYSVLADSIPFRFHDEDAFSDLFLSAGTGELIAVTAHREEDRFAINVYSINYPPLITRDVLQDSKTKNTNARLYYALFGGGLCCILLFYFFLHKRRKEDEAINETEPVTIGKNSGKPRLVHEFPEETKVISAINLFGGFQVFNKAGEDITGKFTMTLRELFVLVLLHSVKFEKGISTTELQEYLWPDKDEVSARNNRNVNIKKLRTLLKEIGDISIENNNAYLHLSISNGISCDYKNVVKVLNSDATSPMTDRQKIEAILRNVKRGSLLPNLNTSWLDNFKSDISNKIIDVLLEYSQKLDVNKDDRLLIEIADSIFNYDSINQEALVIKCSVLNKKGKYSLAKVWYEHYIKEYKILYSENYPKTFEEVIS